MSEPKTLTKWQILLQILEALFAAFQQSGLSHPMVMERGETPRQKAEALAEALHAAMDEGPPAKKRAEEPRPAPKVTALDPLPEPKKAKKKATPEPVAAEPELRGVRPEPKKKAKKRK